MKQTITLLNRGTYWRDLQQFEKDTILKQMPGIINDPQKSLYRFFCSPFNKWIIINCMLVPMKLKSMVL